MTEIDALNNIAKAIEHVAVAIGGVGTVLWLMLFFKDMNGADGSRSIALAINSLKEFLSLRLK